MLERIDVLTERLEKRRGENVAHDELGQVSGFHSVETAKNQSLDYALRLLVKAKIHFASLDDAVLTSYLNQIDSLDGHLAGQLAEVDRIVKEGVHTPQFPNQRQQIVNAVTGIARNHRVALAPFDAELRLVDLEAKLAAPQALNAIEDDLRKRLVAAETMMKEAASVSDALRAKAVAKSVSGGTDAFVTLRDAHRVQEGRWFVAFGLGVLATIGAVGWAIFGALPQPDQLGSLAAAGIRHVLAITAAGVVAKVALTKFNLERNLRILYDHRIAVLSQYGIFDAAIPNDDRDAKTKLRLDLARLIFADPQTGYSGEQSSEFNVSPVVSIMEGFAK